MSESDPDPATEHGTPRWVKGFIVAAVVVVVLVAAMFVAGGEHGPSRHLPGGGGGEARTSQGHDPPVDHG